MEQVLEFWKGYGECFNRVEYLWDVTEISNVASSVFYVNKHLEISSHKKTAITTGGPIACACGLTCVERQQTFCWNLLTHKKQELATLEIYIHWLIYWWNHNIWQSLYSLPLPCSTTCASADPSRHLTIQPLTKLVTIHTHTYVRICKSRFFTSMHIHMFSRLLMLTYMHI